VRSSIRPVLVVMLLLATDLAFIQAAPGGDPQEARVAASPMPFTSDPSVLAYLADLLKLAGGGYRLVERAAFLVAADEGGYRCLLWPHRTPVQGEVFRGTIPPRTIAVMHTHPNAMPRPSTEDQIESRRLSIPFLVASARHVYAISRTGEVASVVQNTWWTDGIGKGHAVRCEPM